MYTRNLRPTTVYEMHIFKDVDSTSWTRPQVHTFKLSDDAAAPFLHSIRSKSGLANLRRCSPAQLSFLQSHLSGQNSVLKAAREAERNAQKTKELRQKEAIKEEEKQLEEFKKSQAHMEEKASKRQQEKKLEEVEEEEEGRNEDTPSDGEKADNSRPFNLDCFPAPPPPPAFPSYLYWGPRGPPGVRSAPVYNQPYPPPPPPPPMHYPPRIVACHEPRERLTRLELESDWTLEAVELDLIPVVAILKSKKPKAPLSPGYRQVTHRDYQSRNRRSLQKLPLLAYELSDSAKVEFAVVYSRTVMTAVPDVVGDKRRQGDVYYPDSYAGDSFYEQYDSDREEVIEEEEDEEGEGEAEEEDKEEDDLEIVEGFKHCHPITESMSKCCLEKEC